MAIPSLDNDLLPVDTYNAVITAVEVKKGQSSGIPYLNVTATIFDGEFKWAKRQRALSFSRKAIRLPGGVLQLVQSAGVVDLPADTPTADVPAAIAAALIASPVTISTNQQGAVDYFAPPTEEFVACFTADIETVGLSTNSSCN